MTLGLAVGAYQRVKALIPNSGAPNTNAGLLTVHQRIWPAIVNSALNTPQVPVNTAVMVDTRGVWVSQGGNVPDGSPLLIDGHTLTDWGYGGYWLIDPTAADPVKCWATLTGPHTFSLGPRSATIRVIYCAANWLAQADGNSGQNITYWGTAFPTVPAADFPQASNGFGKGYGFLNSQIQNNGFSLNIDPAPATSAVFVVAPGASPGATSDIRGEPNLVDGLGVGQPWAPSGALAKNGFDPVFNLRQTPGVGRLDFERLSTYTIPNGTPVDLSSNAAWYAFNAGRGLTTWPADFQTPFTADTSSTVTPTILKNVSSVTSIANGIPISGPGIQAGTVVADINGAAPWQVTMSKPATATALGVTITPTAAASATLGPYTDEQLTNVTSSNSNYDEDQGPGVDLLMSGTTIGVGAKGGWNWRYQPFAAGNSTMKVGLFGTIDLATVGLDNRFTLVWEWQRGVCATANGVPWLLDTEPSGGSWGASIPGWLTLQAGAAAYNPATSYARQKMVVGADSKYYLSLQNANVGHDPTVQPGNAAFWLQCTWQPYGIPRDATGNPATPGGAFLRAWADFVGNGQLLCVSQNLVDSNGLGISVPGTATFDRVTGIVTESQPGAGKIYGIQGRANLAVLSAGVSAGNTTIAVPNQIVSPVTPNFANQLGGGSGLIWDRVNGTYDFIRWTGYSSGSGFTGVSGITSSHPAGSHIHGFIEPMQNSPGINQGAGRAGNNTTVAPSGLALPDWIREWPLMIGSAVANDGVTPMIGDVAIPANQWA